MSKNEIKNQIRKLPQKPGVYRMRDRFGAVLYIGKAKNLRKRVASYFQDSKKFNFDRPKIEAMIDLIEDIEVTVVNSETEALLLESKLIKQFKPHYNTALRDDKRFLMIRLNLRKKLPEFSLARNKTDQKSKYFGPFIQSLSVKKTLSEMRLKFGVLIGDSNPKETEDGKYILYDDARAEIYNEIDSISPKEYLIRIHEACKFLEGKSKDWLNQLEVEMLTYSENLEFEKAAKNRDLIAAIKDSLVRNRSFMREPIVKKDFAEESVVALQTALEMNQKPSVIECFDISHISGSFVVASMVQFQNGIPFRQNYRRFKIKRYIGNDDFLSMEEVVERRYKRLKNEAKPLPDLIVIDGGAGQVSASLRAFYNADLSPPMLIGLAKKEETIIFSDGRDPLNLSMRNDGLKLLQRLRDEAHRFANSYNAELRSKKLKESILDEIDGIGTKKRESLLKHFKHIQALSNASINEISLAPGIGPNLAKQIYDHFQNKAHF